MTEAESAYVLALEKQVRALEMALQNSLRSLAAEGRSLKKARREAAEAKKALDE